MNGATGWRWRCWRRAAARTRPTRVTPLPDRNSGEAREFQLNIDGQQVSADIGHRRPAEVQPGFDRGIPVHLQPLRRDAGPVDRRAGERDHQVGHATSSPGSFRGNFRDSQLQRGESGPATASCRSTTSSSARPSAARSSRTSCTSSPTTNTSASRGPASGTRRTRVQRRADRHQQPEEGRRAPRLSAVVADAADGQGLRRASSSSRSAPATTSHPAATGTNREYNDEYLGQLTQVLSNRALNEVKVGKAVFGLANANLTTWSNHWQAANGITTGSPRITFTGFAIGGNQFYPRHQDQWVWSVRDDFTFSYDARRPPRPEARRRVPAPSSDPGATAGSAWARSTPRSGAVAGQYRGALSRSVQRRHLEPGGDLAARAHATASASATSTSTSTRRRSRSWAQDDWQIVEPPDAESRAALRPELGVFAQRRQLPAVPAGRASERHEQLPAAGRLCLPAERRTVVRGGTGLYYGDALGADQSFAMGNRPDRGDPATTTTAGRISPRTRPTASRCRPTSRRSAVLLRQQQRARLSAARPPGIRRAARVRRTCRAPGRPRSAFQRQFGATMARRGRLRLQPGPQREGRHRQHQPDVQSGHRRQPIRSRHRANRPYPDWGVVSMNAHHRPLGLSRAADRLHQAVQQPLAGVGHLHAVGPLERGHAAVQRPRPGAVPDRAGSGRRVGAVGRRSAPSRGVQRHLAGGPRLPGERAPLPRRRDSPGDQLRRRSPQHRRDDRQRAPAPGRHDRPAQLPDRAGAEPHRPAACSSGSRSTAAPRSTASRRSSTCSTGRTRNRHAGKNTAQYLQHVSAQTRTAQFGFRLTF